MRIPGAQTTVPWITNMLESILHFASAAPRTSGMSLFQGANNLTINGGNFTSISSPAASVGSQNDIVALLYSHSATAALLDAKERFDAPKCDEGTRVSMIRGMKSFVQEGNVGSPPGLYWLHGPAGVGKSALAQSFSLQLQSEGDHAASFFFSRTSSGRNNGNQLIVTLAYQLAVNFPALQPFMSKVVKANPGIINASNTAQMKGLVIDPINEWQKNYNWSVQWWTDRIMNAKPHPRLILVDGLDECNDSKVQADLICCIALAVRQLSTPLRFVITSRPESHIRAAFELDPTFHGLDGVTVIKKNLGEDEDADKQITTFLLKEFASIRKTHPIRAFLPEEWPRPDQIGQLVSKSSKGFIYPTTVTRYIKMPHNRPDECLDRILGLSKLPTNDRPYEPLDSLYRHIFDSVPEANRRPIRDIFHFLVVPSTRESDTRNTTTIEEHFDYPRGHVQHVLHDLLCLIELTPKGAIKVLHASLPDFLLDESRSGLIWIDARDAHATVAACHLMIICRENDILFSNYFYGLLDHLQKSNMSNALLNDRIFQMNILQQYKKISFSAVRHPEWWGVGGHQHSIEIRSVALMVAYLLILVKSSGLHAYIRTQITSIAASVFAEYPCLHKSRPEIISFMAPLFQKWKTTYPESIYRIFEWKFDSPQNELREAIFEIYFLMMASLHRTLIPATSNLLQTAWTTEGPHSWADIVYPNVTED